MKKIYLLLFSVITVLTANCQTAELYKDINNLLNFPSITAEPEFTTVGNKVFFIAEEPLTGKELYVSDGTTGGTFVIDINPGRGSSSPSNLTEMCGLLYFSASDGPLSNSGTELWKSDGTPEGTVMVKDIYESQGISSNPTQLINANGILYFVANDGTHGKELWRSDGTKAGTSIVKDIYPGSYDSYVSNFLAIGNTLYFRARDGINGTELWKSNGTEEGTVMVKDINSGSVDSNPNYLTNVNGILYFSATDATTGNELWKSDGTAAGTVLVKDIREGTSSSAPLALYAFGGNLYFTANDGTNGSELWKFNSTTGVTAMLKDIYSGSQSSSPGNFLAIGSTLFFTANTDNNGVELWKTDGSSANTSLVKDISPGTTGSNPGNLIDFNGKLYFSTSGPVAFYKSDGTSGGTVSINDAVLGGGNIKSFHAGPNKIYFTSRVYKEGFPSTATGTEPWVSDGTDAGTVLLKDINTKNYPSNPKNFLKIGSTVFFAADDGIHGNELWKTDGTAAGTILLKDIRTGPTNSDPQGFTNLNGTLFFAAYSNETGFELWKSDGTPAGTVLVKDIYPGKDVNGYPYSSNPYMIENINGVLYFSANDGTSGAELWRSDGTPGGTTLLKDINTGITPSFPGNFTEVNGIIFFTAQNGGTSPNNDEELWRTDGTAAGTFRVKDIKPGVGTSNPRELTSFKNKLYFSATDGVTQTELWISDGTEAGTIPFREFTQGSTTRFAKDLKVVENTMYFVANLPVGGTAIWKTDGTAAGTMVIKETGAGSSNTPAQFTLSKGQVFFTSLTYGIGIELWKTDGTPEGTLLVKDILPGSLDSDPKFLTDFKGTLYFRASGAIGNPELWKSDGTEAGTVSLDLNTNGGSFPSGLTVMNDYLIFSANDFYKGYELWRIKNSALPLSLLDFTAQKNGEKVLLKWETTNEVNTSVFEIERTGTSGFVKIGEVAAMNRAGDHWYSSYDEQPLKGTNLYRLKMIDIDGSFTYSNIQRADFNSVEQVRISPNPASNELKISDVKGYEILQVMDASGRVVHQQKISGDQEIVNIQKLLPGNYVVRLTGKGIQKSLQFVKK